MVDLHNHILYGIDDGAKSIEESLELIKMQKKQGVNTIVLTPHFKGNTADFVSFYNLREQNIKKLQGKARELDINLISGCELYCENARDLTLDMSKLCIENTTYILIEFPILCTKYMIFQIVKRFIGMGITPIIAHVERYINLIREPMNLYDIVNLGAILQVNSDTVLKKDKFIIKCIRKNLIHLIASDTHDTYRRTPNLQDAYKTLEKLGINVQVLKNNALYVVKNSNISTNKAKKIKKVLGIYI